MSSRLVMVTGVLLDLVLCLTLSTVVLILLTGGLSLSVVGIRLGLRSIHNPLTWATAVAVLRFVVMPHAPFLGLWSLERRHDALADATRLMTERLSRLSAHDAMRIVVGVAVACALIKLWLAWSEPGFYSGDDVEVQEMSLSALLGENWPVWDLRSPIFPIGVIFPAQWLARAVGVSDMHGLVFAGRAAVCVLSSVAIWLVWRVASRRHSVAVGLVAAVTYGLSRLPMAFGSSELPRPVSTVCVLAAFAVLSRRDWALPAREGALAGAALAAGAVLRFSEAIFVVPAVLGLLWQGRVRHAASVLAVFSVCFAAVVGLTDWAYWKDPFHSLIHIVDYTLWRGESSRGFQPAWHYLLSFQGWANWILVALAGLAVWRRLDDLAALWLLCPLLILSALPHKESRYLIPVIPFLAILVSSAVWWLFLPAGPQMRVRHAAVAIACASALVMEVSGWRLPRSNDALAVSEYVSRRADTGSLAAEQLWRLGGRIHFPSEMVLWDLDVLEPATSPKFERAVEGCRWIALHRRTADSDGYGALLLSAGWSEIDFPGQPSSGYRLFETADSRRTAPGPR